MEFDAEVLWGLVELDRDRERAEPVLRQLGTGVRDWSSLTAEEWDSLAGGGALLDILRERSLAVRYQKPKEMVAWAERGKDLAERLDVQRYGSKVTADLRARAWAELGNSYRVADELARASEALNRAETWLIRGTGSRRLAARCHELRGSLLSDLRQLGEAVIELKKAAALYRCLEEPEDLARILVNLGLAWGYDGQPDRAIEELLRALYLMEPMSPLRLSAVHGLVLNLVDAGDCARARAVLNRNRRLYRRGGRLSRYRLSWLEGKIAIGLGERGRAETHLNVARLAFRRVGMNYDYALASLDVALLYARQGRRGELMWLADELVRIFREFKIAREAIASLVLLKKACEREHRSAEALYAQIETIMSVVLELRGRRLDDRAE